MKDELFFIASPTRRRNEVKTQSDGLQHSLSAGCRIMPLGYLIVMDNSVRNVLLTPWAHWVVNYIS